MSKARRDVPGGKPCCPDGTPLKLIIASVRRICAARWHLRRPLAPEGLQPIWARSRLASATAAQQTSFIREFEIGSNMRVGLTGGIGCGKSEVLRLLAETGALCIDCDRIVAELLDGDTVVREALRERFGSSVFHRPGTVDRAFLSARVFAHTPHRLWLENLLHPLVRQEWELRLARHSGPLAVVEIPLLFEKKLEKLFQITVCVTASLATRLRRGGVRGLTREQLLARNALQLPLSDKVKRADYVISNNGSREFLRNQVLLLSPLLHKI